MMMRNVRCSLFVKITRSYNATKWWFEINKIFEWNGMECKRRRRKYISEDHNV